MAVGWKWIEGHITARVRVRDERLEEWASDGYIVCSITLKWIFRTGFLQPKWPTKPVNVAFYGKIEAYVVLRASKWQVSLFYRPSFLIRCVCLHAPPKLITVDRFLVQGVNKVAGILYGVFEVANRLSAAALAPQALLRSPGLVLQFTESGLVWTGNTQKGKV